MAFEWQQRWRRTCLDEDLNAFVNLYCVNQVVLMLTRFYMTKVERSASKQDHLQPRCNFKARSPSTEL